MTPLSPKAGRGIGELTGRQVARARPPRRRPRDAWRRRAAALVGSLAAFALAACGGQPPVQEVVPSTLAAPPSPYGAVAVAPSAAAGPPASNACVAGYSAMAPLPPPGDMPSNTTMARILARGYLIAGVDQDTNLFGYLNPMPAAPPTSDIGSDAIVGFDIDILHQVSLAIFGNPDKIQFRVITQAQRITAVEAGQVDIVADTLAISCVPEDQAEFSDSYFDTGQEIMVPAGSTVGGLPDLRGRRVCAVAGTSALAVIQQPQYGTIPISAINWNDCLVMMEQSGVDAVSADGAILAGLEAQDSQARIVGTPFTQTSYGLVVAPDYTTGGADGIADPHGFVKFINGVLTHIMVDGTWTSLYQEWIKGILGPTPRPPIPASPTS